MDLAARIEVVSSRHHELPQELQYMLHDSNVNLSAIASAALQPRWTTTLFLYFEPLFADTCARWSQGEENYPQVLSAFGRTIPFAPHLSEYAALYLGRHEAINQNLWAKFSEHDEIEILLAIFRLLLFNRAMFQRHFDLEVLYQGFEHTSRPIRYLTIRVICVYLQAADAAMEEMVSKYLRSDAVEGIWEGKNIDYTFLSLWEEKRWDFVTQEMKEVLSTLQHHKVPRKKNFVQMQDLSPFTVNVFGAVLPRLGGPPSSSMAQALVPVATAVANVSRFTRALIQDPPILLTGLAGAGKTSIINYTASCLNKLESMVILHLNEQSDAKMLVGMYTSGTSPGTFVWQPGVLTTAVQEGRWLFIEDLDRAPNEIISVLLPLVERKELLIPSRGEAIQAAPGFRIIASMRTSRDLTGQESLPKRNIIGRRFWQQVSVDMLADQELKEVIVARYPILEAHSTRVIDVYSSLRSMSEKPNFASLVKTGSARPLTPRDLFRWCHRLNRSFSRGFQFSDALLDEMFLEAVDSFVGYLTQGTTLDVMTSFIAEELHVDAARAAHLLQNRAIKLTKTAREVSIGRAALRQSSKQRGTKRHSFFANSPHSLKLLEKLGVAVENKEPVLLVGETGIGKTTCIQHLAELTGNKLVSFNLSQQSESGDLLGGFKPVNVRGLIMPLKDEFDDLFNHPSSPFGKRKEDNQRFTDMLGKAFAKGQWKKVCIMWKSAASEVQKSFGKLGSPKSPSRTLEVQHPSKRRRVQQAPECQEEDTNAFYQLRWNKFTADIKDLESHLNSKASSFAFKFVEGTLVTAIRNGHWVLLDEINLATPDTLEALVDLLGGSSGDAASLLLTESGNIERVIAHPQFRVFAAMNPATDVGKKDLPQGIRSRFTELYIDSPDQDIKSLQHIVRSYLPEELGPRIVADVTNLYVDIQKLSSTNNLVDGAGQQPHFSLRTLTRTLIYARDVAAPVGAKDGIYRRALFEGFHMSFLTLLDSTSEALLAPRIMDHLFTKHPNARAELSKPLPKPADGRVYVQERHYWLRKGHLETKQQPHYIITPFVRKNLDNLIRAISTRKLPILIQGPTSSGKTSMIEYLAKKSGNKFVRINNHEHTDLQEYLGTYVSGSDGRLCFQEGVLVEALRKGHWMVLDELNLAPTDVLEALNRLLDDNRELLIPETQEIITPHPDFMLFATQNPAGLYGGRKHLSRAFRNRFLELHFDDIPVDELCDILQQRTQIPPSWAQRIVNTYKELSSLRQENRLFEQKSFATLRDLFRWALRKADDTQQLAVNGYMVLAERVRKSEERTKVKTVIEEVMSRKGPKIRIEEEALYSLATSPEIALYQNKDQAHGVVWTKSMRRLFVLVAHALRNNEPVLLVGETGCGKTTVVQMLAHAFGKELFIVNAHQNTETGDLIGSQRPIRNRTALESQLRNKLCEVLDSDGSKLSLEELLRVYDNVLRSGESNMAQQVVEAIKTLRIRSQALFEWSDGSLVRAMKSGQYFLLDEISLADDSVLERLNSVLESGRSLLLAEKGSVDTSVTATDEFQFLATMNPGGDYGKRELSPALRNRFTEIWVPSLYDLEDILEIVHAKLVPSAASFADAIVRFSSWFNRTYNTSAASAISIRDTLAWIQFVNKFSSSEPVLAVLQGAAMVYIDTLGANPAAMLSISTNSVDVERRRCIDQLGKCLQRDLVEDYFSVPDLITSPHQLGLGHFTLPREKNAVANPEFTFNAPTTRTNAMRIIRALQLTKPVLIEGNPGVGKTTLVTAISKVLGKKLVRINLSEQTDLMDLFGSDVPVEGASVGSFAWRDAPFLSAMKTGDWVLLDEMNLASQSVLEGLNACLDHRAEAYVAELDQTFSRHPSFRLFAAQNPHHQGGGRKGLPASFVNRFTVVYADVFKQDDLQVICGQVFPDVTAAYVSTLTRFVDRVETDVVQLHRFGASGSPWEFNLRDTTRWLQLRTKGGSLLAAGQDYDFCDLIFRHRFRSATDREQLDRVFDDSFSRPSEARSFYHNLSSDCYQVGLGLVPRNTVTTFLSAFFCPLPVSHLPTLEALMLGVEISWPVLLVGPSGCGKSALLHHLAALTGNKLVVFPMNADIDAMDLVGGYEQADPSRKRTALVTSVHNWLRQFVLFISASRDLEAARQLLIFVPRHFWSMEATKQDAVDLLATLDKPLFAEVPAVEELSLLLIELANLPDKIEKAQFEWVDGLLVRSLERGDWLVLDNANLCSSSVLDRLNSLLEPNGYLSINEHPTEDGEARIVKPHPNFRIFFTMDPRNGELSRAMRNRSIELFMLPNIAEISTSKPAFMLDSAMSRYRNFTTYNQTGHPVEIYNAVDLFADHLTFGDFGLHRRFCEQIDAGLITDGKSSASVAQFLKVMSEMDLEWVSQAMELQSADSLVLLSKGRKQSIHPLNNEMLVRYQCAQKSPEGLNFLAKLYDVLISLIWQKTRLEERIKEANDARRPRTRFEMSLRRDLLKPEERDCTWGVVPFLEGSLTLMEDSIKGILANCGDNEGSLRALRTAQRFWWTMFTFVISADASDAVYQVHLRLAEQEFADLVCEDGSFMIAQREQLQKMKFDTGLSTGKYLEQLWEIFRPPTASSMNRLEEIQKLEAVADRFDETVFPLRAPLQDLARIRGAFQQAVCAAVINNAPVDALIADLSAAVDALGTPSEKETELAIFRPEFEAIHQYLEGTSTSDLHALRSQTALLAGRRTKEFTHQLHGASNAAHTLVTITTFAKGALTQGSPSALQEDLPSSLSGKLQHLDSVPISQLGQLRIELDFLSKLIARSTSTLCTDQYQRLAIIFQEHLASWHAALPQNLHFIDLEAGTVDGGHENFEHDLVKYALSCLLAYVPDKPFDPALKEATRRELLIERKNAIRGRVSVLRTFAKMFFVHENRMRIELANVDLEELGDDIPELQIARPVQSQLGTLQGEFNSVLNIVKHLQRQVADDDGRVDLSTFQNIEILITRLDGNYRGYQDLVMPVVWWLQCLWLGLRLIKYSSSENINGAESSRQLPVLDMLRRVAYSEAELDLPSSYSPLETIELAAIAHKIENLPANRHRLAAFVFKNFENVYRTWKDKIGDEQDRLAKKSSLYVYRGGESDEEQVDEEEYEELFPDFDVEDAEDKKQYAQSLSRETAIRVATVHEQMFCPDFDASELMLEIVRKSEISGTLQHQKMSETLPSLLLMLANRIEIVNSESIEKRRYNIYRDPNIPEAARLASITRRILYRFKELQVMDFEHTTVDDVVIRANEILKFAHTEPVAKYITKAEKLHESMYEWEKVAHKGLSASALLTELTDLIVSWRRLELSTWMQLFAVEQDKAEDDAKSWWFVAYENIIANPQRLSGEDIALHAPELLKALEKFFLSATLGQFSKRLQILIQFRQHLVANLEQMPEMKPVHFALANFIDYFSRFRELVAQALAAQRKQVESQAREVVQLASWRDTNIEALRSSAKSSHKKLFRLVRKFRTLLNKNVASIIEMGIPEQSDVGVGNPPTLDDQAATSISIERVRACGREQIRQWDNLPARFRNTIATVQLMQQMSAVPEEKADSAFYIQDVLLNLQSSISELQKATPSILNEETKDAIKHLKTRKRALFATTLKELRRMGFQYNLSSTLLSKQSSTAVVLASLPDIERQGHFGQLEDAEYHFHKLLSFLPQVRALQQEHSGDLTPAEVARSTGYLEGILHTVMQQRQSLAPLLRSAKDIKVLLNQIAGLWDSTQQCTILLLKSGLDEPIMHMKRQIQWLLPVLQIFSKVIAAQVQLGELKETTISSSLGRWSATFDALLIELDSAASNPLGITHGHHLACVKRCQRELADFRVAVSVWSESHAVFAPVLGLLQPWIDSDQVDSRMQFWEEDSYHSTTNGSSMQSQIIMSLDNILGCFQDLSGSWESMVAPGESTGWLLEHNKTFMDNLKAFHPQSVVKQVHECLNILARNSQDERVASQTLLVLLYPVLDQYSKVLSDHLERFIELHTATARLAHYLSRSFIEIGTRGFCTPPDKTAGDGETDKQDKLEAGTGLGEGEGAEDISKDIGDDEDLTELAQEPDQKKDGDEIEDEKDAVDMADEEMEGQLGETKEDENDDQDGESGDENNDEDAEDEVGSVDDLGPSAVDEKMWDEGGKDNEKEKENNEAKGKKQDDETAAQGEQREQGEDQEEEAEAGAEEDEAIGQQQGEQVDDYTEEADKLDLPEDLNMDGEMDEKSDDESLDDMDDMDEGGEAEDTKMQDPPEDDQEEDDGEGDNDDKEVDVAEKDERGAEEENEAYEAMDEKDATPDEEQMAEDNTLNDALQDQERNANTADDAIPSEVQGMGTDADNKENEQSTFNSKAQQDQGEEGDQNENANGAAGEKGYKQDSKQQDAVGRSEDLQDAAESQPFKKLGDALEKWFNQQRQIKQADNDPEAKTKENKKDVDMADVDFEHLLDEESQAEAQALGAATEDQAHALDKENAVAANEQELQPKSFVVEDEPFADNEDTEDVDMKDGHEESDDQPAESSNSQGLPQAFIGDPKNREQHQDGAEALEEFSDDEEEQRSTEQLNNALQAVALTNADARTLWTQHEQSTRTLAATLTEQLRLILAPTLATKLRGDFRTGKRLNIKRIIPYIASSYKRDKIWMRRSVPSKRAYQIMIALDDSKSMAENGKKELAFNTLALVSKALSMLEVGELCILGFGETVQIAHPFDRPFTDDAGVDVFSKFMFDQGDTDVRKLVEEGIAQFQDARAKATSSAQELWQLMLVVSDAICRDSESIRRLVRQAQEERIMVVFVVIDAGAKEVDGRQVGSIMDLQGAEFRDGHVHMYKYMDTFPFRWWVLVRDVRELPGVLAMALRQWFAEVVDTGGY